MCKMKIVPLAVFVMAVLFSLTMFAGGQQPTGAATKPTASRR